MDIIHGKAARKIDAAALVAWAAGYSNVTIDLGTGDGRFVRELARRHPEMAAIGIDLNASNLRAASRRAGDNARFVVADALALPGEMRGLATTITINFPWGSLLRGLLAGDRRLLVGLVGLARPGARLRLVLNAGALAEAGYSVDAGQARTLAMLRDAGFRAIAVAPLAPPDLRQWPTTWAKRLAFGRDPRAVRIEATFS